MTKKETLKNATLDELENWLMELEMSNSYTKYEETIKAIRAEIDKRNGIKKNRKSKPRKMQKITIEHFVNSDDKMATEICEKTTVKALNEFIKKTGWKIKRSLRKAEKIKAIIEWRNFFRCQDAKDQFEIIKAGKFDRLSLLALCNFDAVYQFAESLNISVYSKCGWLVSQEQIISTIAEKLAA